MGDSYLNLSVRDFLDTISGTAETKVYSVPLSRGRKMEGTWRELAEAAIEYQNCDIGEDLIQAADDIMQRPIHQYNSISRVHIINYVEYHTNNYDSDRVKALYKDVLEYYSNIPAVRERIESQSSSLPYTAKMEDVRYMKDLLLSKLDPPQDNEKPGNTIPPFQTNLQDTQLKSLFIQLKDKGYIAPDTDESSFIWALGERKCPETFKPINWIKPVSSYNENISKRALLDLLHSMNITNRGELSNNQKYKSLFICKGKPLKMSTNNIKDAEKKNWKSEYHNEITTIIQSL